MKKRKYKSVITKRIFKSVKKLSVVLLVLVFSASFCLVAGTNSAFMDTESSNGNSFQAGTLDLELDSQDQIIKYAMLPGNYGLGSVRTKNEGTVDFQYKIEFLKVSGDDALCSALTLSASKNGSEVYSGALAALNYNAGNINSGNHDDWSFQAILPAGSLASLQDLECNFSFEFTAWQASIASPTSGFIDSESLINNEISSGDWTAPVITSVKDSDPIDTKGAVNNIKVNLIWTTNENATSNIVYDTTNHVAGTPADYPSGAPVIADITADHTSHSVQVTGLNAYATYYYRVISEDSVGNEAYSAEYSFNITDPKASTPGQIVMNEFVPDPVGSDGAAMPAGEWIEVYNNTLAGQDISGWYFKDADGNKLLISASNSDNDGDTGDSGETIVPAGGYLVVYDNSIFSLNNGGDSIYFYNDKGTPLDEADDTLMDSYTYGDTSGFDEGKTFARIPDGTGPWIDPDGTPGEKNELTETEKETFQKSAAEKCFVGRDINDDKEDICQREFLVYLGMLANKKDKTMKQDIFDQLYSQEEAVPADGTIAPVDDTESDTVIPFDEDENIEDNNDAENTDNIPEVVEEPVADESVAEKKLKEDVKTEEMEKEEPPKEEVKKEEIKPEELKKEEPKEEEPISI